ncbi:hypothetical protein BGZ49_005628 [Haplosporangium sp. Z 27]|nr:hypothetical protein BGZ49_005628 [Haplosporangium sp. Z 27]
MNTSLSSSALRTIWQRIPNSINPSALTQRQSALISAQCLTIASTRYRTNQQQTRFKSSDQTNHSSKSLNRKESAKDNTNAEDDERKEKVEKDTVKFKPARLPVVLCHGFLGFDTLWDNPDFSFDYWYGVREALNDIGCNVYTAKVPPFSGIQQRAKRLQGYIEQTVPHGSEVNLIAHSMGGLDCRYLISHIKSPHFKVKSLTTLATPHRGSSFADYVMSDIVGKARLEKFWTILNLVGIERGAADNLTTHYISKEFNPNTPDDPDVKYFSFGASYQPGLFSRFRFPWKVINDREGPNDGLVSVESSKWGTYVRTIPNADHMDLMNWVNALAWSRARFPWILGGSSHDPEGRPKGAFETDSNSKDKPKEEAPLFNAIELYLEISDMLYKNGL